jgi:hypothetical protein
MTKTTVLLDPTAECSPELRERLPRPKDFQGLTVGLLDISKARGDVFLDEIEAQLTLRGMKTRRYKKPTFARVAPIQLKQEIGSECAVVIEALAD